MRIMATIADLENGVLDRLQDDRSSPVFWHKQNEVRVAIAEAMFEAMLISGLPQEGPAGFGSLAYTLQSDLTLHSMPVAGSGPFTKSAFALLELRKIDGTLIPKCSIWDLDQENPSWESETGATVKRWFPYGLTRFGIYPKLSGDLVVYASYVAFPVSGARPYDGTQSILFIDEHLNAFEDYASHVLRLKEGSTEFADSMAAYNRFLQSMSKLTSFATTINSLRFSRSIGAAAVVVDQKER